MNRHKLLERQIKRHLSEQVAKDPAFQSFLNAVSESYDAYDRDNSLADHAFRLSELEYVELNTRLKQVLELKQESIARLIESIKMVDSTEGELEIDQNNLLEIVQHLEYHINQRKQAEIDMLAAMETAEKANMAKSDFLSIMSHEIRTPLNAVIGMAHLLLSSDPKPEQLQNLRVLKTSSENLLMLINDILDFSKIESGKLELEEAPFSLSDLCLSLRDTLMVRANEKGIRLKVRLDSDIPGMLLGDALRMSQILNNLLSNAIKFTKDGQVDLNAEVLREQNGLYTLSIEVKDTGIGIPSTKLQSIFTRFTQASEDTSRQFGGTGLGLAITKNLLELMGTSVQVDSVLGVGSTFRFEVQLKSVENYEQQKVDITDFDLMGARVLLVEDTAFNILFAKQLLEGWNAQVDVAENGKLALDRLEEQEYQIILMDLLMPELDGFSATLEIRKRKIKTPIIALTASATNNVRKRIELVGMQDYVTKPFSPKELFVKMRNQIQFDEN
jgi:signal transduction histidine kinase